MLLFISIVLAFIGGFLTSSAISIWETLIQKHRNEKLKDKVTIGGEFPNHPKEDDVHFSSDMTIAYIWKSGAWNKLVQKEI